MSTAATLCLLVLTVKVRLGTTVQPPHHPQPDCRFWPEPKQNQASLILQSEKDREGSVFYFWSQERQDCSPCTVCPPSDRTLSHCSYIRDTLCVSQTEWIHRGLQTTSSGLDILESRLRNSEPEIRDEGVVRLRSAEIEDHKQPAVFGVKVFDTDESIQLSESPTRKVHRKYGQNSTSDVRQEEEEEYYGTPIFSEESKNIEGFESEQPVMTVLREMLNNKSAGLSVKDLVNISHTYHSPQSSAIFPNHNEVGGGDSIGDSDNIEPSSYKHTQPLPPASTSHTVKEETEAELYDDSEQEYKKEKSKEIWPYRTDDQYSLFYFHPPSEDEKDVDEKEYLWPSLYEYENEYHFQPREPTKQENLNQEIAPHTTAGSLIQTQKENEYPERKDENTAALENIFIGITSLVIVLIGVLIYLTKTRSRNRFKLLDNSDNVSSYHSVSPADNSLALASPSPVSTGLKASSSSSSGQSQCQYDRSKLSIPLQPYSSSRSASPVGNKSPSYLDKNLMHPSVARSLRNIKETNNDIQPLELELDLNNKLF